MPQSGDAKGQTAICCQIAPSSDDLRHEHGSIARAAVLFALREVCKPTIRGDFGRRWLQALGQSFQNSYQDTSRYDVFARGLPANKRSIQWPRQEYLHDVAVVEFEYRPSAIRKTNAAIITKSIWQVESEVAESSSALAEDLGKLVSGSAISKLLIAAVPRKASNLKDWLDFINYAALHVNGNFFLALIPSYSEHAYAEDYRGQRVSFRFYQQIDNVLVEDDPVRIPSEPTSYHK